MPLSRHYFAGAFLFGVGLLSAGIGAHAGVLYKCSAKDGSVAYVGKQSGFTNCKVISTFADSPEKAPTPKRGQAPKEGQTPVATAISAKHGWVYEENVKPKADFSAVSSNVASTAAPPEFSAVRPGSASTAPILALVPAAPAAAPAHPMPVQTAMVTPVGPKILRGAVYKVERKGGITEYTNVRPTGSAFALLFTYIATCVACDIHSKINFARTALNLDAYKTEIAAAAADYGVDSALLRAVIHAESAFNPMAISSKGAQGLMQLMPDTASDLGVTNAFDTAQNIRGGARYLGELLKDFNGNIQLATAAYNAGPAAVQKYHGVPPYDETQLYVQRVATLRDRYQKAL
jgi:soluble lytic murein transglycosylase-like protein